MIATLGTNVEALKPGAVLNVTGASNEIEAQQEVADFLQSNNRDDLGYFSISKDYFLLYVKYGSAVSAVA